MATAIIVDDSPIMRIQLRNLLGQAGCLVVGEAASGDEVLALYEKHKPDLITLDIVMPGKDGVTAATELLSKHPRAVVIMCTSLTTREKVLACQRVGVSHYLLKPFQAERAVAVFRHVLSRGEAPRVGATR
ncbi:MAG: response regulator [Deltaproteobacteria bacterium]|nr:response regulator [Deltaproteobacteria bacterium]